MVPIRLLVKLNGTEESTKHIKRDYRQTFLCICRNCRRNPGLLAAPRVHSGHKWTARRRA